MEKEQFLYKKIYVDLKNKILTGELAEGACLPQTGELASVYGVSTITITNALNALRMEGYLNRIKGKGSFVQLPAEETEQFSGSFDGVSIKYEDKEGDRMLGLVLEHVSSCFGLDMMYAMDAMASEAGYKLCVRFSYGEREKETEEIEFLKELGVNGIIVMPCHGLYYNTAILKLVIEEFPMVLIDKKMEGIPVPSVRTDNHLAMKELVEHLVRKGNKKIGFITFSENDTSSIKDRRKGFLEAIKAAGLENMAECRLEDSEKIKIYSDDLDTEYGETIGQYLSENQDLDAVICAEYGIARWVGDRKGITVCCIDEDYLSPGGPRFTHIKQDEKKIAFEAIRILLKQVEKDSSYSQMDCLVPGIFCEY
ncbi:GntR family transcriptional regulator [Lacrimispora indolis]|uniref:GntR family transcriptional regulator n=1 Tax=Lacrimispora indolis TaxID=69825 RepID=UPI0003FD42E7|nr:MULTISPECIES: GntR family transcriptional regulator [Lachnospiraceae]MBE7719925.1 GntR family transcriptional regulator [Lacrimispora celerecrescens]